MKRFSLQILTAMACIWASPLWAQQTSCTAVTQSSRTALVELYTSEGCSSCPPADRWLSEQVNHEWDPQRVVALAFHVDYWDRLGWQDRFAQHAFSVRQRALAAKRGTRTVYTPQLLVSGQSLSLRSWPQAFNRQIKEISTQPAKADIHLELSPHPTQWLVKASGRIHSPTPVDQAQLFIALYQDHLSSQVENGENEGKLLRHDRVVRTLLGPLDIDGDGRFSHDVTIDLPDEFVAEDAAVVVFLQRVHDSEVVQALERTACRG